MSNGVKLPRKILLPAQINRAIARERKTCQGIHTSNDGQGVVAQDAKNPAHALETAPGAIEGLFTNGGLRTKMRTDSSMQAPRGA